MPTPNPMTVNVVVGALKHSGVPNIVVEGKDDQIIYRELIERMEITAEVLYAGGRPQLLQVYERRSEFANVPVAFIADQDMWLFRGIPAQYNDIIWTEGYSIENDLYSHVNLKGRVGNKIEYNQTLDSISMWFAYKVEEYLGKNLGKTFKSIRDEEYVEVAHRLNKVIPLGKTTLASGLDFLPLEHQRVKDIRAAYNLQLRGKLLFELLVRFLNKPSQGFRNATVSYHGLYNDAITLPESDQLFSRLKLEIQEKLREQKQKIAAQKSTS